MNETDISTAFYIAFSLAEKICPSNIRDVYQRFMDDFKGSYKHLTEIVMVLNFKAWKWSEKNVELSRLYCELYEKANDYAHANLKGDELTYYYNVVD